MGEYDWGLLLPVAAADIKMIIYKFFEDKEKLWTASYLKYFRRQ